MMALAFLSAKASKPPYREPRPWGLAAWAAGSAPFMPALADAVPAFIECVTIARERDPAGQRGADELGRRLEARGIETVMWDV